MERLPEGTAIAESSLSEDDYLEISRTFPLRVNEMLLLLLLLFFFFFCCCCCCCCYCCCCCCCCCLLFVVFCCCLLLFVVVCCCLLLFVVVCCCLLLLLLLLVVLLVLVQTTTAARNLCYFEAIGNATGDRMGCLQSFGNASHALHSMSTMIEKQCRLGGCCKGGVKTTDGAPVFVSSSRLLPVGRDKNWSPPVVLTPPPLQQQPTFHHVSTPGMGICEM